MTGLISEVVRYVLTLVFGVFVSACAGMGSQPYLYPCPYYTLSSYDAFYCTIRGEALCIGKRRTTPIWRCPCFLLCI